MIRGVDISPFLDPILDADLSLLRWDFLICHRYQKSQLVLSKLKAPNFLENEHV